MASTVPTHWSYDENCLKTQSPFKISLLTHKKCHIQEAWKVLMQLLDVQFQSFKKDWCDIAFLVFFCYLHKDMICVMYSYTLITFQYGTCIRVSKWILISLHCKQFLYRKFEGCSKLRTIIAYFWNVLMN